MNRPPIQARKGVPGFSVWYDRWNGRKWCWREKASSRHVLDAETDVREGTGYPSERAAYEAVCAELKRRRGEDEDEQPDVACLVPRAAN